MRGSEPSSTNTRGSARPCRIPAATYAPPRGTAPACASRFGHAFSVTAIYGSVTTYPEQDAPAGRKRCTSTSYEADEHCTRRGCHVTRHTDGRPASRDADGNPTHAYGTLPFHAQAEKNSTAARPDRMARRRQLESGHIGAKKKPDGGRRRKSA
ncbi:MAG: hypothetical protein OXK17_08400 [Thaumarchaeota archaeon]|nr:hypothetical protein [Nitrososphaerota archaeon]